MTRIVCQVLHRADRVSFLWSEGEAPFEPYHLEGKERENLLSVAEQIHAKLAAGEELAQLGHQLYRAVFRQDASDAGSADGVQAWLAKRISVNEIDRLEFLSDAPGLIPYNLLAEDANPRLFWGTRFNLGAGRRVNALRGNPALVAPTHLGAVDVHLVQQLPVEQQPLLDSLRKADALVNTTTSLADELKNRPVDVLSLLVRFERGQLWLGADAFSLRDLQSWIEESREGNPDPIVILMASGPLTAQCAWHAFLSAATAAFSGIVANEVLLPASQTLEVGQGLAQRFIQGTESLGECLRTLRKEHGAAALAFSAFGPPQVRVVVDGATHAPEGENQIEVVPLPLSPYRPFAAFEAADRPLFIGREEDALRAALALDHGSTVGVILHGSPAVGKTSFLQAGLLPFLEQECLGYRVLRDRSPLDGPIAETAYPILILRCTSDLAGQFADALSVYCAQPLVYTTPAGTQVTVDLPAILQHAIAGTTETAIQASPSATSITASPGEIPDLPDSPSEAPTARELWIALRDNKDLLARVLDAITRSLPFELVIAVDQGEELLTLVSSLQQKGRRQKALDMLMHLSRVVPRCKILYTIRSQSLGQLLSLLPEGRAPTDWRTFYLSPLTEGEMVDALVWPTNRDQIPYSNEAPYQKFRFAFEDGMAQQVVADAIETAASEQQSPLPILQAVGALLYDTAVRSRTQDVVRVDDLKEFGGVKDALATYLERSLDRLPISKPSRFALRQLIGKLYVSHADGTLSRDVIPASDLKNYWRGSAEPAEPIVNQAADELGLFEIQQLLIGGQPDVFVSLPQDSLAQLAKKIDSERSRQTYARTKVIDVLWIMIPLLFLAAAVTFWATRQFMGGGGSGTELEDLKKEATEVIEKHKQDVETMQARQEVMRRPMYYGQLAQVDQALRAGNALRARQLLLAQPAMRSFVESRERNRAADVRGFEWKYLWRHLNGERHLLEGHRSVVNSVAVSADSKRAASASDDGTIRVWNLANGEILALMSGSKSPLHAVAFAPDGKTVAAAGADKLVRLWDISKLTNDYVEISKEAKTLTGHSDAVHAVAFSKDSQTLASAGADKSVILWDVTTGNQKHTLKEHAAAVLALAFSNDGKTLVSAGAEAQLIIWDAEAGKKAQAVKTAYQSIAALAISSDGKTVCTGGVEARLDAELGMIRFWNLADAKETQTPIQHGSGVLAVALASDGKAVASGGKDHIIRVWDIQTGKQQQHWLGHLGAVRALALTKDGDSLVSGSHDATVKVWNPGQSSGAEVIAAHADWVQALALNGKNTLLASGSRDGSVKLWDPANGKPIKELAKHQGAVTSLAFSYHKDKTLLAVGTRDEMNQGEIKIWQIDIDPKQGVTAKETHTLKQHKKGITCLAFYPAAEKADLLISGSADMNVKVWDAQAGKEKENHVGHKDEVRCVAFSFDGKSFASGGKDALVCFHELESNDVRTLVDLHLGSIESITLLQIPLTRGDGHEVATGILTGSADHSMRLSAFDHMNRTPLGLTNKISFFRSHGQGISGVSHHEMNNGLIVSGSWDGTIKLYDLFTERFTLLGHQGPVRAIAVAADQSYLASAGNDGTIRFWRTHPARAAEKVEKK